MQVTILENFRTLVKGMVYDFKPYTVIGGENGCGKTHYYKPLEAASRTKLIIFAI